VAVAVMAVAVAVMAVAVAVVVVGGRAVLGLGAVGCGWSVVLQSQAFSYGFA
jgi:hypothetical protein